MRWLVPAQEIYGHLFDLEPYFELIAAWLILMPARHHDRPFLLMRRMRAR